MFLPPSLRVFSIAIRHLSQLVDIATGELYKFLNCVSRMYLSLHFCIQSSLTLSDLSSIEFNEDDVLEALSHLKTGKSDGDGVSAEHLICATSALTSPLAVIEDTCKFLDLHKRCCTAE